MVDIAVARLGAKQRPEGANAVDGLLALAADSERRPFIGWSLEAKLAAWEVQFRELGGGSSSLRNELADAARRHGFGRILRRLENEDRSPLSQPHTSRRASPNSRASLRAVKFGPVPESASRRRHGELSDSTSWGVE